MAKATQALLQLWLQTAHRTNSYRIFNVLSATTANSTHKM